MRVIFSVAAEDKLADIYAYIALNSGYESIAERLIATIKEQTCEQLSLFPFSGSRYDGEYIRFITIKRHVILYEIKPNSQLIQVLMVYGAGEDWY